MKKAVVTLACGDFFQRMAAITHPTIRAYANKIDADFIVWDDHTGHVLPHYKKFELGKLLDNYDRVLYVDTDILIRDDAPDIFAVVPENELGMLKENVFRDCASGMIQFMESSGFNSKQWDGCYYNSGVMVLSKEHRNLFVPPAVEWDDYKEQTYLNVLISQQQVKVFSLSHRFNRVCMVDWTYGEDRLNCYFLHFAGMQSLLSDDELLELIRTEFAVWERNKPHYRFRNNIAFLLEGSLGEQMAAEPSLRFARDVVYRGENIIILCNHPELFRHLDLPIYEPNELIPDANRYHARLLQKPLATASRDLISPHQIHAVNLAALNLLGLELPVECKTPKLIVDSQAMANVIDQMKPCEISKLVLLHPGRALAPNTFPADVWQSYADVLVRAGFQVAVIGRRIDAARGVVEFDTSKCLDLIDRLPLAELIALISQARVLISNDSAPVQIAGAFDGWIGLIATLRHPDYALPWRHSSQSWRARNLERVGMYGDYFQRPTRTEPARFSCPEWRMRECLSEPEKILDFVNEAMHGREA